MTQHAKKRRRKGEGSLFVSEGYYFYTFGYTVNGQQRKKKKCLGSEQEIKTARAAWTKAVNFRNQFIADIKTGKVMTSDSENVTCDPILTQYIEHVKEEQKPAAGSRNVSKLTSENFSARRR